MSNYDQAIGLLERSLSKSGYLASPSNVTNYRRVWSRDGIICGLAAMLSSDTELILGFRQTLITLGAAQTELGHIPSNVAITDDGMPAQVSLGGIAGRADTIAWWILGVCNYAHFANEPSFAYRYKAQIDLGLRLMRCWEYNNKGLMYVPQSGDWADEYVLHGYVLYDQALRLCALQAYTLVFGDAQAGEQAANLKKLLKTNYWINKTTQNPDLYHARAYELAPELPYFAAALTPGGYAKQFDSLANALCILAGVADAAQTQSIANYVQKTSNSLGLELMPAFFPPIMPNEPGWLELQNNYKYEFRNLPHEFHNGGTWAMTNGFLGAAMCKSGFLPQATQVLASIESINQVEDWGFYENFNTQTQKPIGTKYCAWSAAAQIILQNYLKQNYLLF